MIKILLAEDDVLFAQTLEDFLSDEGFYVTLSHDGADAEQLCYENHYDLLLLDINMPSLNGLDLLESLRQNDNKIPAIYLTSFKDKQTLIQGFQKGADDYLKKPVDLDELLLRIQALLQRTNKSLSCITIGNLVYDKAQKTLTVDNRNILLSKKLSSLMDILIENQNRIVSKEEIKQRVWKWNENASDGALRVYINDLKKIVGKERIQNIKGIGYKLEI